MATAVCQTESRSNPIAAQYPNDTTGTINGTTAIIPIPYDTARSLIPSQYGILTHAYESLIPNLPKGTYPAVLEAYLDHDVQGPGTSIPDFQRIAIKLPFVDRLNDGYTSFKYSLPQLISLNLVAYAGSLFYGSSVLGNFVPSCNPYQGGSTTTSQAYVFPHLSGSMSAFNSTFSAVSNVPYSMDVFKNVTNQPQFGSGFPTCDNYITLFNSSVTGGEFAPTPVQGTVSVVSPFFAKNTVFTGVMGYRMDNAFVERNNVPCEQLKGYSGSGSGD